MANTESAKRAIRRMERRTQVNRARRSRMRSFIKQLSKLIETGDKPAAQELFRVVQPEIMRAASRGVVHKKTASRTVSRLSARVKAMA